MVTPGRVPRSRELATRNMYFSPKVGPFRAEKINNVRPQGGRDIILPRDCMPTAAKYLSGKYWPENIYIHARTTRAHTGAVITADKRDLIARRALNREPRKLYFCRVIGACARARVTYPVYYSKYLSMGASAFRTHGKVHREQLAAIPYRMS